MQQDQVIIENLLVSYFYKLSTQANAPALLFLHGWRSQKEVWNTIMNSVTELSGVSLYALDLPGFGQSEPPRQPFSVGDYAHIVRKFIEKKQLANVILIGHSFGGRVGIKLAAESPSLIAKLVLVDSAGFVTSSTKKSFIMDLAKIVKPIFGLRFMQIFRKKIYQRLGAEDYTATPELKETFIKVVGEDLSPDMKKITCPTLIVTGENDTDTPVEFGERMHGLVKNSQFEILQQAGHFSFVDKPQEFISLLTHFIS